MWIFLALALLLLPVNRRIAGFPLLVAIGMGAWHGVLDWRALCSIVAIVLLAGAWHKTTNQKSLHILLDAILFVAVVALTLHLLPGFHNPKVLDAVKAGPQSAPFSMYFNFDKALVPFVAFIVVKTLFTDGLTHAVAAWKWLLLAACIPGLMVIAVMAGGLKPELHFPSWLPTFLLANIFFVSLAEEALFRGWIQQRLTQLTTPVIALFIASGVFGLTHLAGGPLLVAFAMLAGLIYGLAWMWSRRLWVAVLFHVAFNLCHLMLFTYPLLARG